MPRQERRERIADARIPTVTTAILNKSSKKGKNMLQEVIEEIVLTDVPGPQRFWTHSGTVICNIFDLARWLETCSEYDFRYHVNTDLEKNDFAKWIEEVIMDHKLARKLEGVLDKEEYLTIIRKRLERLTD